MIRYIPSMGVLYSHSCAVLRFGGRTLTQSQSYILSQMQERATAQPQDYIVMQLCDHTITIPHNRAAG
jgi:hypothetical protein